MNLLIRSFSLILFATALTLVAFAIAAPVIQELFGFPRGEGLYATLGNVCHQYPTRSFWILNRPFALCARCTSGYLGVAVVAAMIHNFSSYKFHIHQLFLGMFLLSLAITDPLIQLLTEYESSNLMRFLTGLLGGTGFTLILLPFKKGESHETSCTSV
jgi:uncharacterized membrane protein